MASDDEPKEGNSKWVIALVVAIPLVAIGLPVTLEFWPYIHGATPAQLMDEPLAKSPKQLASDLPGTKRETSSVTVGLKLGAGGEYQKVEYNWASASDRGPNSMRIRAGHDEKPADVAAKLTRHFHAFEGGSHQWGAVTITLRDRGDLSFEVQPEIDGKPNALFDRQIEAAKEVILNAAFDLPLRVSDREIADVLGAGYAPSVLAAFDVTTPVEQAATALATAMPATLAHGSSSFNVPHDHPLVRSVRLSWANRPQGQLESIHVETTKRYPGSRASLESCFAQKLGQPKVNVTDYAGGKQDFAFTIGTISTRLRANGIDVHATLPIEAASFSRLFQTLDACRESGDSGGTTPSR